MRRNVNVYAKNEDYVGVREYLRALFVSKSIPLERLVGADGWPTPKSVDLVRGRLRDDGYSGRRRWIEAAIHELAAEVLNASTDGTPAGEIG